MRYPRGYPPVCQRPLFGLILRTTCNLHISSHTLRKPALSDVLCSVPRFTARCILGESRVLFCVGLVSEANLRKKVSYNPESDVCSEQSSDETRGYIVTHHLGLKQAQPSYTMTMPALGAQVFWRKSRLGSHRVYPPGPGPIV